MTKMRLVYEVTGNYYKDISKNDMMRTFVAVEISNDDVIHSIKKIQDKININAKAIDSESLHFTLQFLGHGFDQKTDDFKRIPAR